MNNSEILNNYYYHSHTHTHLLSLQVNTSHLEEYAEVVTFISQSHQWHRPALLKLIRLPTPRPGTSCREKIEGSYR